MNNSIRYTFIALGFAIIIPIAISIFLIKKSYELERKKFDIEVSQLVSSVFFSFRADYVLLDSIINQKFIVSPGAQNKSEFDNHFKNELLKTYRSYASFKDSLKEKLIRNNYKIEFEYSLEISDLRIIIGDRQKFYISDSIGVQKQMVLFGNLTNKKTAASYSFYHMGSNNYIMLKLYIDYPGRNQFLIKRMWPLIAGIIFSMLVLILILVYTVKVLFWQKKVSDMKSHFIDNITHEFNTPVSTLKIIAANIKKLNRDINSKALDQVSVRVENQAGRLSGLIGKVVSLSANEKGNINYKYKVQNLNGLLVRNVEKYKQANREKIKLLKINISAEKDEIIADDYYLSIAILNILDNAVKYSVGQAEIDISTNNQDDSICLSIKDKGIGMKPSEIKQVFKRFYRGGTKNIYKAQGLGLGLSIVKQIVNAHKGKIFVESKVDHGTEFKIVLPLKCAKFMGPT